MNSRMHDALEDAFYVLELCDDEMVANIQNY